MCETLSDDRVVVIVSTCTCYTLLSSSDGRFTVAARVNCPECNGRGLVIKRKQEGVTNGQERAG